VKHASFIRERSIESPWPRGSELPIAQHEKKARPACGGQRSQPRLQSDGDWEQQPSQNRDPPYDRRTRLNINHAMCDERFGERGPSGSWCFSPLGKPGGWRPPFALNPTFVARVWFGTKNGTSRALENCLATESRRPL